MKPIFARVGKYSINLNAVGYISWASGIGYAARIDFVGLGDDVSVYLSNDEAFELEVILKQQELEAFGV
jgi:hypothetical protein